MKLDLSHFSLANRAFSEQPMAFMDSEPKQYLSNMLDLIAVETAHAAAVESWQKTQIKNLLKHAYSRSAFWRKRVGGKALKSIKLGDLPILRRDDMRAQFHAEGSLVDPASGLAVFKSHSSGSSGRPVQFYLSTFNANFNSARSIAQYFIEGRDLRLNRTRLMALSAEEMKRENLRGGLSIKRDGRWLGPLDAIFKSGKNKQIAYWLPEKRALREELSKDAIGYLIGLPGVLEAMFDADIDFLVENKIAMCMPLGGSLSGDFQRQLESRNIPVRGSYSCEEAGMLGVECPHYAGHYHVARSNVVFEANRADSFAHQGVTISQLLVTHLHSYATPFIRYDLGDYGVLHDGCRCGHIGQTISHIHGRAKALLRRPDGRLSLFLIHSSDVLKILDLKEFRVRQTARDKLVMEVARDKELDALEVQGLRDLIGSYAGDVSIQIEIKRVDAIDWGGSTKKLGFRSEVL